MATVYGIVKQSDGYIDVVSEEGVGTEFRLLFPRAIPQSEAQTLDYAGPTADSAGVILIVEDQESVRAMVRNALQRHGYTVVEAGDGQEALDKSAQLPRIDLLLTDVVMPRLNRKALAARLTAARPGLRVLYMTGYSDDAELIGAVRESQAPMLQKPFSATGLLQRVRETLGAPA